MKNKRKYLLMLFITTTILSACKKDFLDKKPSSTLVVPEKLSDLYDLLENSYVMNVTGGMPQISADEYWIPNEQDYWALSDLTSRNVYLWKDDLYEGEIGRKDWNDLYSAIFYANSVLTQLDKIEESDRKGVAVAKGWALFARAFSFYDLVQNFCEPYGANASENSIGLPIRLDPAVDYTVGRSSLEACYRQILDDLEEALPLLDGPVLHDKPNRPSKAAVYALLARIFLNRSDYQKAEHYVDSCLRWHSQLIDYNSISTSSITPFGDRTDETIYFATQVQVNDRLSGASSLTRPYAIVDSLVELYKEGDLRLAVFFNKNTAGFFNSKRRYTSLSSPFSGLATDEMYLIKAECAARRRDEGSALSFLNELLRKRYKTEFFRPEVFSSYEMLLETILEERKKELVWRGTRWQDLKRLNQEGRKITLKRTVGTSEYHLPPLSSRYVFPIPSDELIMSGIEQNNRTN